MPKNSNPVVTDPQTGAVLPGPADEPATEKFEVPMTLVPDYPRDLYDSAHIENGHRDFNSRILEARGPQAEKVYKVPDVPVGIQRATALEMEAGRKRVAEFADQEVHRQELIARQREDKWSGKSTPVFRPPDVSEYKATLKSQAQTVSKDALRQPPR